MVDYTLRENWDSLASLKRKIDDDTKSKERVISFDGVNLVTNKFDYSLFNGKLTRTGKGTHS